MNDTITIQPMTMADYEEAMALWRRSEGIGLRPADAAEHLARFLDRNPGLSFVARSETGLVGTALCGHDGRRGYLHHLAVDRAWRGQGIGRALVEEILAALKAIGINKCHLFVMKENQPAIDFWQHIGWELRKDIVVMSHFTGALDALTQENRS
ncbi:MAG TPA: GNAT family N-acetyltransferase [Anaerolineae bacterium]|nr:GNAT family N-acetyltransferase [Anaerolineae bacterium]